MEDFKVSVKLEAVDGNIAQLRKDVESQFETSIKVKFDMGEMGKASGIRSTTTGLGGIANQLNRCRVNLNTLNGAQKINSLDMKKATAVMKTYGQYYDVSTKKSKSETAELTRQATALRLQNAQRLQGQRLINEGNAARDKAFKTEAAFIRLQNQARSFYTKNQANIADKGGDAAWRASIAKYGDATQWVSAAEAQTAYLKQQKDWVEQGVTGQTKVNKALLRARELTDFSKLEEQARDYYNTNYQNINKNAVLSARWQSTMAKMQDPKNFGGTEAERIGNARSELAALRNESERAGVSVETLGQRLNRLFGAHFNTALVMGALHALQQSLVGIYKNVVEVNTALTQFQIVSQVSGSELNTFAKDAFTSARKISASATDVVDAATVYKRLGYSTQDSLKFSELTTMYSKVGDVDMSSAEDNITAIVKAFDLSSTDLQGALDKMVYVGNNFPISASQLGEGLNNAASSLAAGGNTLEQSIALLTSAMTTTQD